MENDNTIVLNTLNENASSNECINIIPIHKNETDNYESESFNKTLSFYEHRVPTVKAVQVPETLKMCRVRDVKLPQKAHNIDAGFDFFVPNDFKKKCLFYNNDLLIPSGVKVIVPHGYALIAMNKSGVALKHKLQIGACVVDEGYTGEVHIHIYNFSHPNNVVDIVPGMKLVQFVLVRIGNHMVEEISADEYASLTNTYERGEGAFGSTGA